MRQSRTERRQRLSLTLLFAGLIFCVLMCTVVLGGVILFLLFQSGLLSGQERDFINGPLIIWLMIFFSLAMGAVFSFYFSRYVMRPVGRLVDGMMRLASGDFRTRISFAAPLGRHPTVLELSDSFNTMAAELQQTEMLRSDFINNFSHEFKTPIVSIAGFAKLLKRGNLSEEKTAEYLDVIEKESMRLSQMATNVLSLTKVENVTILTDIVRFNLSEQLRTCMLMLEDRWSRKSLEISVPDEEFFVEGNKEMMNQVWINLLDNAIKFSYEGGRIGAHVKKKPDRLEVSVTNTGDPIPEENMDKIFNKFYQTDESHAAEGNGVGLAVVKKIVDLHDGDIRVRCADGVTTFTVILPA